MFRLETHDGLREKVVLLVDAQALLRIALALGVAGGLSGANDDRYEDAASLKHACTDLSSNRELEDVLSDVRGTSNGGFDPLCDPSP